MATTEFSQDKQSGDTRPEQSGDTRPELDEPRRTTESGVEDETPAPTSGGYGGVTEDEPPHHKIHSDDEKLPKPASGTYDDDEGLSKEEQVLPTGTDSGYGDAPAAPKSTEDYQDYRSSEPQGPVDETPEGEEKTKGGFSDSSSAPPASEPRSFGEEKTNGGYSDPSSAFAGAPVDRKLEEPGYGQDTQTSEPVGTEAAPESPTPKKEGLISKIKDHLPGHHKTSTPETVEDDTPTESGTPKKGFMAKIKEKLPGHHSPTPTTVE